MVAAYDSAGRGRFFGDDVLDEIRAKSDIVGVIGEYVPLKKRGANYLGLCPFHSEKTPSFTVSPDKQMFYCFGCQTGGNVFTFLMKREGLTFGEAVELLANRAGVPLPERSSGRGGSADKAEADRRRQERETLYRVMDFAVRFYERALQGPAGEKARGYLERRGITQGSVEAFRIGYSLPVWDALTAALAKKDVEGALIETAGLALKGRDGYFDRFRNRLMFTISDQRGRPIGFGARALDEGDEPKYMNSPETPLFSKGKALYALHQAARSIRRDGRALVVEGYMDVIACHEHGFDYAVASMGTAFTPDQARALRRLTENVVTAFDADTAGTQATIKGLEVLTAAGCGVKVAEIPDGKDPDDCLRTGAAGVAAFARAVDEAVPLVEYRFRLALRRHDPSTVEGRVGAVTELLPVLAAVESPLEQEEYLRDFAVRLPVPEDALRAELARYLKTRSAASRRGAASGVRDSIRRARDNRETLEEVPGSGVGASLRLPGDVSKAERLLLACMFASSHWASVAAGELGAAGEWCREVGLLRSEAGETVGEGETDAPVDSVLDWFSAPGHRRLAGLILEARQEVGSALTEAAAAHDVAAAGGPLDAARLVDELEGAEGAETLGAIVFEARLVADDEEAAEQAVGDCVRVLKEHRLNSRIEELHRRIGSLERELAELRKDVETDEKRRKKLQGILFELIREQIDLERHTDGGTGHWKVPGD